MPESREVAMEAQKIILGGTVLLERLEPTSFHVKVTLLVAGKEALKVQEGALDAQKISLGALLLSLSTLSLCLSPF